jgi:calcium-translocating P-type ATPase
MTDAELDKVIPDLQILARATPMDKFRLVERLKILNEVVAVTGDGTNDAPALKKADVGLAMGIAGTEIAKEASDIIILDDNFVSIVRSCMWGRNVYDNIRKFLQFQLTINAVALVLAFIGAVTQYGTPLKAVQLLWVNLIMDTMAALALGTEKPTPSLLSRKPYGRKSSLISRLMWRNIIGIGILQLGILFWVLYGGVQTWNLPEYGNEHHEKPTVHYTMVFNTFVFLQIFNEINSRMVHGEQNVFAGFITNPIFVGVEAFTIVGQVLITEFGGYFTMTTHLDWLQWISCVALGISVLPVGFLIRLIPIPLEAHEKSSISEDYQSELEFLTNKKKKGAAIPGQQIPPK